VFRSRLEARWAMYFDLLGLRWEYEAEALGTEHGPTLPDFRLHTADGPVWLEVKPCAVPFDFRWRGYVVFGPPWGYELRQVFEGQLSSFCCTLVGGQIVCSDVREGTPWDGAAAKVKAHRFWG
jgi:hypothetical protein